MRAPLQFFFCSLILLSLLACPVAARADCADYSNSMQWLWGRQLTYYIPGWQDQNATFDLTKSGNKVLVAHYPNGLYSFEETSPGVLASRTGGGYPAQCVLAVGDRAYATDWNDGLRVYDISDLASFPELAHLALPGALHVAVSNGYAYVSRGSEITVVRMQEPLFTVVSHFFVPAQSCVIRGNRAYITTNSKLLVASLSNPAFPFLMGSAWTAQYLGEPVIDGDLLCVGEDGYGLRIFSLANPDAPTLVGGLPHPHARIVIPEGDAVLLGDGSALTYVDVTDPSNPVARGSYRGMRVMGGGFENGYAYLAAYDHGVQTLHIGEGLNHPPLASVPSGANGSDLVAEGNHLAMLLPNEVRLFDLSSPEAPTQTGSVALAQGRTMTGAGDLLYVIDGSTLRVINVADPSMPTQLGAVTTGAYVHIAYAGGRVYLANDLGHQVPVVDVSNPSTPTLLATPTLFTQIEGIAASGRQVCVNWNFEGSGILDRFDFTDPASPELQAEAYLQGHLAGTTYVGDQLYAGGSVRTYSIDPSTLYPTVEVGDHIFGGEIAAGPSGRVLRLHPDGAFEVLAGGAALHHVAVGMSPNAGAKGIVEAHELIYLTDSEALRVFALPCAASSVAPSPARATALLAEPNPFGGETKLSFSNAAGGATSLQIHDAVGRLVRSVSLAPSSALDLSVFTWDGRDDRGGEVPTGVYFARAQGPSGFASGRIVRVR